MEKRAIFRFQSDAFELDINETVTFEATLGLPDTLAAGDYELHTIANLDGYLTYLDNGSCISEHDCDNLTKRNVTIEPANAKVEVEICVGNPISTTSGRKLETEIDYQGTGPFPLRFARYYSSHPENSQGWRTSYSRHLVVTNHSDGSMDARLVFDTGFEYRFDDIDKDGHSDPDVPGVIRPIDNGYACLDAAGTIHEFDATGRLTRAENRNGFEQTLTYAGSQLASISDHFGRMLSFEYNADGLLSSLHTPDGQTYRYRYNDNALLSTVILPDDTPADDTEYTYTHTGLPNDEYLYHVGLVTERIEAAGTVEARTTTIDWHPDFRLPVTITEPGRETHFVWDDNARLIRREMIALDTGATRTWQYSYNDAGLLIAIDGPCTDVDDTTRLEYNEAGEVTAVINALGHTTHVLDHDGNGLPLAIRDPNGLVTRLAYDAQGRLTAKTVESAAGDITTGIDYDANGNVSAIHLPDGQTLHYEYDLADRLVAIENDLGERIEFTLDADGNRTAEITEAADQSIVREQRRTFDALGRLIETLGAAGQSTQFGYDLNGNLTGVTDALNRLTAVRYPSSPRENIDYHYDEGDNGLGRLTRIDDPSGETAFTYDQRGNLIMDTRMINGARYTTRYDYNRSNQMTELIYPSGRIVHYKLDALSRVTAITTQANAAAPEKVVANDFDYLPYGPASGWTHGNGLDTDIDYDRDYRITDIDFADLDEIMSLTYRYNDVPNITRMLDNLGVNDQQFGYDALNRLAFASGRYGEIDYSYDGVGNRQTRTIDQDGERTRETYAYEAGSHRIERVTTSDDDGTDVRQFEHDDNGNIVSNIAGEREPEMIVNARNRLKAIYKDGEQVGEYEYNALGQRVAKTSHYRGRLHAHFDQANVILCCECLT